MSSPVTDDAQRREYRRSARRIGIQVAAVSAALVGLGGMGALAYLAWQATPAQQGEAPTADDLRVYLDPDQIAIALVFVGVAAVMAAGVAAWLIARRAVRPLDDAARAQRRFVADASHELRTPLAVMSARAQLLSTLLDDDPRRAVADELRTDVSLMVDIVDDLLSATRAGVSSADARADVATAARRAADDLSLVAADARISIDVDVSSAAVPLSDAHLRRCLVALLDNAIAHAPGGSVVRLRSRSDATQVVIEVSDTGDGITGIAPERVFDRFAHGAPTTRTARTGTGIGLALVSELAAAAGGVAEVAETGPAGTIMRVRLPRLQDASGA